MKKLNRLIEKLIADAGATIIERPKSTGHMHFVIRTASGATRKLNTANTPRIPEHTLKAVERDLKRMT